MANVNGTLPQGVRPGIRGIRKFLAETSLRSNWHIFTRHNENDEYAYVTFYSLTAQQALKDYIGMGWTFDGDTGNGLYFTENI